MSVVAAARAQAVPVVTGSTVLALDFGERRIGVAVGDTTLGIAHPVTTVHAADDAARHRALDALLAEWQPALIVVGLPRAVDGSETGFTRRVRNFGRALGRRCGRPVEFIDERYSSASAGERLRGATSRRGRVRHALDAVAAQTLLEAWFHDGGTPA